MNEFWLEIAKVGGPVVLVVLLFLKHLRSEREASEKRDAAFLATLQHLNDQGATRAAECHQVHAKSIETIERNTASYERMCESHDEMKTAFARLVDSR